MLNYYIATPFVEEHVRLHCWLFIFTVILLSFLKKQNATHSSKPGIVERLLLWKSWACSLLAKAWLTPSTGRIYLQRGGVNVERWEADRLRFPFDFVSEGRRAASPQRQGWLWLALLTSAWVSALVKVWGVSTVVPLYIQRVKPRSFPTAPVNVKMQIFLRVHPFHSLWPSLQAAIVFMHFYQWPGRWRTAWQSEDFKSLTFLCYGITISKRRKQ